jgi:fatty-acyl-CoA synthase
MQSDAGFDWVDNHARRRPDSIAVATVDTGFQLTWAGLEARVGRLAHLLAAGFGVGAGHRVALIAESDARYFEIQFALMRLGAAFVPLNIRLSTPELIATTEDAGVRVIVHDPVHTDLAAAVGLAGGVPTLRWDEGSAPSPYDAVNDPGAPVLGARRLDPAVVAQIMYTSGTTGTPKGVMCTNGQLAANAVNMAHVCRCADHDAHALNYVPLFHAGGLNIYCNPVLYWGGRVTTTRGFNAAQALSLLCDEKLACTISNGVLQMFEQIAQVDGFDDARFPTLRVMLFGGFGPGADKTYAKWLRKGPDIMLGYGSTELGPMICMNDGTDDGAMVRGAFGRPVPYAQVRCVDEAGAEVPPGEIGEIQARGPAVTAGYWGREDQGFRDGWFSIGDVGYFDTDGLIHVTGRLVERYRSGGENIYPAEVETVYMDMPGIVELAVTGVPDEKWGEVGLIVVVPEPGATITHDDLVRHAEGRLARYKIPHHLQIVDTIPRSTTLKPARNELRANFVAGTRPVGLERA